MSERKSRFFGLDSYWSYEHEHAFVEIDPTSLFQKILAKILVRFGMVGSVINKNERKTRVYVIPESSDMP